MFRVDKLAKSFGARVLFADVSLTISEGEKVGLVGQNGSGKSTLLRVLAGLCPPDEGTVDPFLLGHCLHLSQDYPDLPHNTVGGFLSPSWWQARRQLELVESELAGSQAPPDADSERRHLRYLRAYERFDELGGYEMEAELAGLVRNHIAEYADLETKLASLSAGQRARLSFCRCFLKKSKLLLLDEPTNNLDAAGLEWLESMLIADGRAALVASHDRRFLDRVTTRTLVISHEKPRVLDYQGNYSFYRARREADEAFAIRRIKEVKRQEERLSADIRSVREQAMRAHSATTNDHLRRKAKKVAAKAKAREKRLAMYLEKETMDKPRAPEKMRIAFSASETSRKFLVTAENLRVGYNGRSVIEAASFELAAGQRVVLTGPNGSGKSTLLGVIAGDSSPLAGKLWLNPCASVCYQSQTFEKLDRDGSVLQFCRELAAGGEEDFASEGELRTFLHRFQFCRDDVHTPLRSLSAGERCKLMLSSFMLQSPDLIILDEPTNHLDVDTIEMLQEALSGFSGALLVASHDRHFVDALGFDTWLEASCGRLAIS